MILGEFDSFAPDELRVHLLDLVHVCDFELVEVLQMFFNFLSSVDQFEVDHCELWSDEFQAFVDGLGQEVGYDVHFDLGISFDFSIRSGCASIGKTKLHNVAHVFKNGFAVLAFVLELLGVESFEKDVEILPG